MKDFKEKLLEVLENSFPVYIIMENGESTFIPKPLRERYSKELLIKITNLLKEEKLMEPVAKKKPTKKETKPVAKKKAAKEAAPKAKAKAKK